METSLHYQLLDKAAAQTGSHCFLLVKKKKKKILIRFFFVVFFARARRRREDTQSEGKVGGVCCFRQGHRAFQHGGISWRTDDLDDSFVEEILTKINNQPTPQTSSSSFQFD